MASEASDSVKVEELISDLPSGELWGSFRVKAAEGSRLELVGWALGVRTEVARIELVVGENVVASTTPHLPRYDIAEEFPSREAAANCGFGLVIEGRGTGRSTLELRVVFEDGQVAPMGALLVISPAQDATGAARSS